MNETLERDRNVAMGILKPSPRDLERGLKLHAESVVIDAYGFAPRAAIDGEAVKNAAEAGATENELEILREDMSMTRCVSNADERKEFEEGWGASGVACILQNAGQECQSLWRVLRRLARFTFVTDWMPDFIVKAIEPEDIVAAKRAGKRCLYLTANAVPLMKQWNTVEEELAFIRVFYQLGTRMMHLTYNRRNLIGDGCAEPANGGLSDFGRAVVAEMNRVGVIVDVAHSGWQTSLEAARASHMPMVASHTVAHAVNTHVRGKPDDVIRAIADTDGYVGICCVPAFLGRGGDLQALLDHIDYVAKRFGCNRVAIGTDNAYRSRHASAEEAKVPRQHRRREPWYSFWPPHDPLFDEKWRQPHMRSSLAWTNWPVFTVGLVQRGYSDDDIRMILGGNVLRVAKSVLTARKGTSLSSVLPDDHADARA